MDIRQLYYFLALAEELHFGRAAARVHIAQPALSQQIKALEQQLDLPLFVRDRRHVALTAQGRQLQQEAQQTVTHYQRFLSAADSLKRGYQGRIQLGYVGSAILEPVLMTLLGGFRRVHPGIEVIIEEHDVDRQLTLLLAGELDVALVRSPVPAVESLSYLQIAERPLIAVLPCSHPLLTQKTISLSALANEAFLIQDDPPGIGLGWSAIAACRRAGFTPRQVQATRDVSVAIGLVAMEMGVTLVPYTQAAVMRTDVGYCLLDDPLAVTTLTMAWRRNRPNAIVNALVSYIQTANDGVTRA